MTWKLQLQLEWRRSKVLEYASQGFSQKEIAARLQVDESTISRDLMYLREQARHNIKHYIEERLPLEFEKCLAALNAVRRDAWMAAQQSADGKLKIQALALVKDCASTTMDLLTNSAVVNDAVRFVEEGSRRLEHSAADNRVTAARDKADDSANDSGPKEEGNDLSRLKEKDPDIGANRTATTNKVF